MRLLTDKDLCGLIQVSSRTLRRWRSEGRIPFMTLPGGTIRYSSESISSWLQRGCPKPRQPITKIVELGLKVVAE